MSEDRVKPSSAGTYLFLAMGGKSRLQDPEFQQKLRADAQTANERAHVEELIAWATDHDEVPWHGG